MKKRDTDHIEYLVECVEKELDSRNLKSNVRFTQLKKVVSFIKEHYGTNIRKIPSDKNVLKSKYEEYKGKCLNSAEKSAINELYNQLAIIKNQ